MKTFTESEATGGNEPNVSCGDLVRLNDGREVVKVRHSMRNQKRGCVRNSGECCTLTDSPLCGRVPCTDAIYLEKLVYLQLKLVGEVE